MGYLRRQGPGLVALALMLLAACAGGGAAWGADDYYVAELGSDTTGDGTAANPWATIQTAIDRINYEREGVPRVHVAAGEFNGRVRVNQRISILGAGSDLTRLRSSLPPRDHVVQINAGLVTLEDVTIDGSGGSYPGLLVVDAFPILRHVRVLDPWAYGIQLRNCAGFEITDCHVGSDFPGAGSFDVGIDVAADDGRRTAGTIQGFTNSGDIDHIINVIALDASVIIRDCDLTGSMINYADGIRVQGPASVAILNTRILRSPNADPATDQARELSGPAGVDVGMSAEGGALVTIDGCTISGFDVGVLVRMNGNRLLVQRCQIAGNVTAAVKTSWPFSSLPYPVLDFGEGALGSVGANTFGATETWGFQHLSPFAVSAQLCDWSVPLAAIPSRIYDHEDDPALGTVFR